MTHHQTVPFLPYPSISIHKLALITIAAPTRKYSARSASASLLSYQAISTFQPPPETLSFLLLFLDPHHA
jgi:hypothetical protein